MAVDPVSAGLGAASLISGKSAQKKAEKKASSAESSAKRLEDRATRLWDMLFANAEAADKSGQFDPARRIAAMEKSTAEYEGRDLGNLAGALTTAGYRKGDSEIGRRLDAVKIGYRRFREQMVDDITNKAFFEKQQAYASASPGILAAPTAGAFNRAAQAGAEANSYNPSQLLQYFLPSLQRKQYGFNLMSGGGHMRTGSYAT